MEKIVDNGLTPEETHEVLEVGLIHILQVSEAKVGDEVFALLASYDRRLRIALGLPVEVPS